MSLPTIEFSEDANRNGADALTFAIGWMFELTVKGEDTDRATFDALVTAVDQDGWIMVEVSGLEFPVTVDEIERMVYL